MTSDPLGEVNVRITPQSRAADPRQVPNSAGGFTFTLDRDARLRRFLTLGVDGGTYYATARELARANAAVVAELALDDPASLVREVVTVSDAGRAPRQQPALFALALAAGLAGDDGRRLALAALPQVARTGTHLLTFVRYVEQFRGWGRGLKRAVAGWYLDRDVDQLAYQVVKYRQRDGWSHRDLLRLAHPLAGASDFARRAVLDWVAHRDAYDAEERLAGVDGGDAPRLLEGFERVQQTTDPREAARLVTEYGLSWEMLPDAVINSSVVWEALLERGVPPTALMKQLPRLTRLDMLRPTGTWTGRVAAQLQDVDRLRNARVHPMSVLVALRTYAAGVGDRGSQTWRPSRPVVDALDAAFYAAFGAVEPTGRRLLLALDVSGSMTLHRVANVPLTPREASAALALVTASVEPTYEVIGFTGGGRGQPGRYDPSSNACSPLAISPRQRLDDVVRTLNGLPFGRTDCAQPVLYALQHDLEVDAFVIYTDNETWAGSVHPHQALRRYREATGIPARLVVVGMAATEFTVADPTDAGSLDVVGFDLATPQLLSDFVSGKV